MLTSVAGAHSHIRGLGLDDALEPRQVMIDLPVTTYLSLALILLTVCLKQWQTTNLSLTRCLREWWVSWHLGGQPGWSLKWSKMVKLLVVQSSLLANLGRARRLLLWVSFWIRFVIINRIYMKLYCFLYCKANVKYYMQTSSENSTRPGHDWELFIVQVLLSPLALTHLSLLWLGVRFSLWRWARQRLWARPSAKP